MNEPVAIQDYVVLGLNPHVDPDDPQVREALERLVTKQVMLQYDKPPKAILLNAIDWKFTSDWREVEEFQPAHDCVTCRAANDQAIALLKEFPDRRLALGNLSYWEVW